MDKQSAIRLLDETFNSDFDLNRFIKFVKELFNNFTVRQKECTKFIASQYKDYIASFDKIGDYENARNSMEVLVVQLNKTSSRDRARTMQRNFIANWLDKTQKDAALVAFYGDDPQDWRFSFVKMEYRLAEVEPGKIKAVKELTPAKRYSFLVGVNEPNHTCRRQFLELVQQEDINPTLEEIEKAFSIDNVTKEFFHDYKDLYIELKESLGEVIENDPYVKREFEEKNISTVDFAKKLMGQIVFIYFLQKKGWLGVGKEETGRFKPWGTGPKNFLRKLFDKEIVSYDNFFNDILEPLFYEALATERDDDYYSRFNCKIPFLNGGLFEPINNYDWAGTEIVLSNSVFEKILTTFDQYNFTVKEDEPLEKEVAIDPEMLGKVFENLLDIKDRKSTGRYYTPREIVHYMCQQSLINYLETNISISRKDIEMFIQFGEFTTSNDSRILENINVKQDKLKKGIINAETFQREVKQELDKLNLPKTIIQNKEKIDELLREIKIVDPAVGSGAFPVGMLNEIVKARATLSTFFEKKKSDYELKREIIENCLYGVDIDSSAVDIAKLRFWLSLIVDEEDIKNIKPLPNLDYKIMCGNSLLEEFEGKKLFDENLLIEIPKDYSYQLEQIYREGNKLNQELHDIHTGKIEDNGRKEQIQRELKNLKRKKEQILSGPKEEVPQGTFDEPLQKRIKESQKKLNELKALQKKFFDVQNRNKKRQLRADIERIEWELIEETLDEQGNEDAVRKLEQYKKNKSKPFFLWKLYFSEVFQRDNPGFDVVIANPPYVEHKKLKQFSRLFQKIFSTYSGTADLYVYFYEKSFDILRNDGSLAFITSNKFMKTSYGKNLRSFLSDKEIDEIIDFTDIHVFKALVASCVLVCVNRHTDHNIRITFMGDDYDLKDTLQNYIGRKKFLFSQNGLSEEIWKLESQEVLSLKAKIDNKGRKIKDINGINIYRGITTGYNPAFVIDNKLKNKLIEEDKKNHEVIKPLLQGRDIKKWRYGFSEQFLIFTRRGINIIDYPRIEDYLLKFQDKLYPGDGRKIGDYKWYEIQDNTAYYKEFEKEKIIWGLTADKWAFSYDDKGHYLPSNGYILTSESISLKLILGQLNSHLLKSYFGIVGIMTAGGAFTLKHETIRDLPMVFNTKYDSKIIDLVDQILSITKDDDYLDNPDEQAKVKRLEKEIDKLAYELYELTPEEIEIVEALNKEK